MCINSVYNYLQNLPDFLRPTTKRFLRIGSELIGDSNSAKQDKTIVPPRSPKCLSAQIGPKIHYISGLKYTIHCKDVTLSQNVTGIFIARKLVKKKGKSAIFRFKPATMLNVHAVGIL
jgi:hypothetical protein